MAKFYCSKVKKVLIPLLNYKPFHKPIDMMDSNIDPNYIDRKEQSDVLFKWISEEKNNYSGTYLVTGYRGMGKTSFVGKTIREVKQDVHRNDSLLFRKTNKTIITIVLQIRSVIFSLLYAWVLISPFLLYDWNVTFYKSLDGIIKHNSLRSIGEFLKDTRYYFLLLLFITIIYWVFLHNNAKRYIQYIKINVGNDLKDERDILSIIANTISDTIKQFIKRKLPLRPSYFGIFCAKLFLFSTITSFCVYKYDNLTKSLREIWAVFYNDNSFLSSVIYSFSSVLSAMTENPLMVLMMAALSSYLISFKIIIPATQALLSLFIAQVSNRPSSIIKSLDVLIARIRATIDENSSLSIKGNKGPFSMTIGQSKKYPPLSVSEIEYELSGIINRLTSSRTFFSRFIIVLDEWDKLSISCTKDKNNPNISQIYPSFSNEEIVSDNILNQKEKQHEILKIFGQLKYFTSNSTAKFIFIAGHELYDAYLADVSDREFSVSSMFNGVLNLQSFLSSKKGERNITEKTEEFVWQAITGPNNGDHPRLTISKEEQEKTKENDYINFCLKQFITYLTFTSNGAPKKLVNQFEKYVITKQQKDELTKDNKKEVYDEYVVEGEKQGAGYYLLFKYSDMQKIGFIHYIAFPIFNEIININGNYNDRLLVSSLFLISHIYKEHNGGFSWRNLEYLPELVESAKTPELRKYIKSILGGLEKTNLDLITSGIYSYKFSKNLAEEISIFSRKFEEISAIFNFSFDYFKSVKKYFFELLDYYEKEQPNSELVLAAMYTHIADILVSEEDYSQAVKHYRISCEKLHRALHSAKEEEKPLFMVRYTMSMLRFGLAYEKRNANDNAYLLYDSLTNELIGFRRIRESLFGMESSLIFDRVTAGRDNRYDYIMHLPSPTPSTSGIDPDNMLIPSIHNEEWSNDAEVWSYGDELADNLNLYLSPDKKLLISKLTLFEDLRIMYLPILAKLFSLEKNNLSGITKNDIDQAISEFDYLFKMTNFDNKYLLEVDFYRKLGDILYYKNRNFYQGVHSSWEALFSSWNIKIKDLIYHFLFSLKANKQQISSITDWLSNNANVIKYENFDDALMHEFQKIRITDEAIAGFSKRLKEKVSNRINSTGKTLIDKCYSLKKEIREIPLPCAACQYYYQALRSIMSKMNIDYTTESKSIALFNYLINSKHLNIRHDILLQLAQTVEAVGNVNLSCSFDQDTITISDSSIKPTNNLERFILYNRSAILCYDRLGLFNHSMECAIKILHVVSFYNSREITTATEEDYFKSFAQEIIKNITGSETNMEDYAETSKLVQAYPDLEELFVAYYEFVLSIKEGQELADYIKKVYCFAPITKFRSESISSNRIASLHFKEELNRIKYNGEEEQPYEEVIADSIFCLETILNIINTTKPLTTYTNTYISNIYNHLSYWYKKKTDNKKERDYAESYKSTLEMAKTMHTEGRSYQKMIESFYILDDDLRNNTAQFYLAYERYKLRCQASAISTQN